MKSRILLVVVIMISHIMTNQSAFAQNQKNENIKEVKLQTTAHTEMCKAKIENTFAYEKGIISSELNRETQILTVKYNSNKTDITNIIKVITDLGHDALEITDKKEADESGKIDTLNLK